MTENINFKIISDAIFMDSDVNLVLIGNKQNITFAARRKERGYEYLDYLIGEGIEKILNKTQLSEVESNNIIRFSESLKFLSKNDENDVKYDFSAAKTDEYTIIKITSPRRNFDELIPRVHYFTNMVKTHFEDSSQLSSTVIGSVIKSESIGISNELERLLM